MRLRSSRTERACRTLAGLAAAVLLAALPAGCGGGGEETAPPDTVATQASTPAGDAGSSRGGERSDVAAPDSVGAEPRAQAEAKPVSAVPRPRIEQAPIPFPQRRREEMAAYAVRHYGIDDYRLRRPAVIVEHVAVSDSAESVRATFAVDAPDAELGELPGLCAHFIVDSDGTILQLVPLNLMCRHTVGLNYTSIGIEHTGYDDQDVMGNRRQLAASLKLTAWLRCRFGIPLADVIGHNESVSSPYHRERVASLRNQTHGDFVPSTMEIYRGRLSRTPCR